MIDLCFVASGFKLLLMVSHVPRTSRVTQTAVSRRMEATGSTPTKSFCRLFLSPNSKNSVCLQCDNQIDNADKQRKVFDRGEKTQFCKMRKMLKLYPLRLSMVEITLHMNATRERSMLEHHPRSCLVYWESLRTSILSVNGLR